MLVEVAGTIFWYNSRIARGVVSWRQLVNRVLEGYQIMFLDISEKLACSSFGISGSLRVKRYVDVENILLARNLAKTTAKMCPCARIGHFGKKKPG